MQDSQQIEEPVLEESIQDAPAEIQDAPTGEVDVTSNPPEETIVEPADANTESVGEIVDDSVDEIPADENISSEISEAVVPEISISAPIFEQQIQGSGIIIAVLSPADKISSAWFSVGELDENIHVEENFSSDFNSLLLTNGDYNFSIHACVEEICAEKIVPIVVNNILEEELPAVEENPSEEGGIFDIAILSPEYNQDITGIWKISGTISKGSSYNELVLSAFTALDIRPTALFLGFNFFELINNFLSGLKISPTGFAVFQLQEPEQEDLNISSAWFNLGNQIDGNLLISGGNFSADLNSLEVFDGSYIFS
ncbi:MAG: hypothetical protein Q7K42_01440, partial [Candidatus Diapherotrites archaeon]|nr:hypothetical protein [Candidatus Diapherotrites archaeon]